MSNKRTSTPASGPHSSYRFQTNQEINLTDTHYSINLPVNTPVEILDEPFIDPYNSKSGFSIAVDIYIPTGDNKPPMTISCNISTAVLEVVWE